MIARTRRRLLQAAVALREHGTLPPGVQDPQVMWEARSGAFDAAPGVDWLQAYREQLAGATRVVSSPCGGD
jgi:hypothetical protein